jgi:hypothetical protein
MEHLLRLTELPLHDRTRYGSGGARRGVNSAEGRRSARKVGGRARCRLVEIGNRKGEETPDIGRERQRRRSRKRCRAGAGAVESGAERAGDMPGMGVIEGRPAREVVRERRVHLMVNGVGRIDATSARRHRRGEVNGNEGLNGEGEQAEPCRQPVSP